MAPRAWIISALLAAVALGSDLASPPSARRQRPAWQGKLATYSIASVAKREGRTDWNEVTQGNKIVLPPEVLDYLMRRGLPFDKFQLLNPENGRSGLRLFTGPLDFCAAKGECYLPSWVMKQLGLKAGDACAVATANFPSPMNIKFQPHTSDFLDMNDHYTVLTRTLENMGGLTQDSWVRVTDGQRSYTLDVVEVQGKPMAGGAYDDSNGKAVSIGLLECPVEFEEPKDIQSKKKKKAKEAAAKAAAAKAAAGQGEGEGEEEEEDAAAASDGEEGSSSSSSSSSSSRAKAKPPPRRKAAAAAAAADSAGGGGEGGGAAAAAAAKPVPKFKKRKAAEEAGEVAEDEASPFAGKARSLGGSSSSSSMKKPKKLGGDGEEEGEEEEEEGEGAEPSSALAKARAAKAKKAKEEAAVEAAAAAEAAALAEGPPPSQAVVVVQKVLALLQALLKALVQLVQQLLMPSDVSHD